MVQWLEEGTHEGEVAGLVAANFMRKMPEMGGRWPVGALGNFAIFSVFFPIFPIFRVFFGSNFAGAFADAFFAESSTRQSLCRVQIGL